MAERRMFAKTIIDSDAFLDMPMSTQCLYFHLSMRADDEGFINNPKKIARMVGAGEDDLKLLLAKRFILGFESGVIVIKHWKIHNLIRKDRLIETVYQEEKALLTCKENGVYTDWQPNDNQLTTICQPSDNQMSAQDSIGKVRKEKDSKDKVIRHKYGEYTNVLLSDEELEKLKDEFPVDWSNRIERLSEYMASKGVSYKSHLATIRAWARKENKPKRESSFDTDDFFEAAIKKSYAQ